MHKRLAVFVLAIVIMACFLRVDAADDSNSLRASSDRHRAQDAGGSDGAAEPASESSDAEGPAAEPDSSCPENRQDRCLGFPGCRACPCVYAEVEALLLEQVPLVQNRPIIVDANTGTTFLSTTDLGSDFDPGLRAMFGVRLCNGLAVEFSYFGLSEGGVAITEKPDPASYLIFSNNYAGNVFVNMNRIQTDFTSYVNSFELNFPCCCGCCTTCGCGETTCGECGPARPSCGPVRCSSVEWFAGVRYLDIGNWLNMAVERNETGGVEEGSYNIRTSNHLIGGQIGAAATHRESLRLGADGQSGDLRQQCGTDPNGNRLPQFPPAADHIGLWQRHGFCGRDQSLRHLSLDGRLVCQGRL